METQDILTCKLCGHEWESRLDGELPKCCPKCKRYDWRDVADSKLKLDNKND
jgi:hypothetical protein